MTRITYRYISIGKKSHDIFHHPNYKMFMMLNTYYKSEHKNGEWRMFMLIKMKITSRKKAHIKHQHSIFLIKIWMFNIDMRIKFIEILIGKGFVNILWLREKLFFSTVKTESKQQKTRKKIKAKLFHQ